MGFPFDLRQPADRGLTRQRQFDYYKGAHFIQLLPLPIFLPEGAGEFSQQPPPLYAGLILDDPNLH